RPTAPPITFIPVNKEGPSCSSAQTARARPPRPSGVTTLPIRETNATLPRRLNRQGRCGARGCARELTSWTAGDLRGKIDYSERRRVFLVDGMYAKSRARFGVHLPPAVRDPLGVMIRRSHRPAPAHGHC